jgi:hypothetical protein
LPKIKSALFCKKTPKTPYFSYIAFLFLDKKISAFERPYRISIIYSAHNFHYVKLNSFLRYQTTYVLKYYYTFILDMSDKLLYH